MGYKLITQIVLILTALVIVFAYVKPELMAIKAEQDKIFQYTDAVNKTTELNTLLSQLKAKANGFSQTNVAALDAFLPAAIDPVLVMSDLNHIATLAGVQVTSLSADAPSATSTSATTVNGEPIVDTTHTSYQDFKMSVSGSYSAFKKLLALFDTNKYQLDVVNLDFTGNTKTSSASTPSASTVSSSVTAAQYNLTVRVYAFNNQ